MGTVALTDGRLGPEAEIADQFHGQWGKIPQINVMVNSQTKAHFVPNFTVDVYIPNKVKSSFSPESTTAIMAGGSETGIAADTTALISIALEWGFYGAHFLE